MAPVFASLKSILINPAYVCKNQQNGQNSVGIVLTQFTIASPSLSSAFPSFSSVSFLA
jgi:hypothetical protein